MGFLKHIRSRSRLKSQQELQDYPKPRGPDRLSELPRPVVARIFHFVCPHTTDETFEVNEKSLVGSGCGLCDLRDLANCALVNRRWYLVAQDVLYHSVRIDAVHFCPHEEVLAERRRRKNIDPSSIPVGRLKSLERTVWARPDLAARIMYFKLPYMTREAHKAELARTVSALPNLRYVDLPDGFYSADPSTQILRDELQTSCQEIKKMSYVSGAEQAFESLAQQNLWMGLETLELNGLDLDLGVLRMALASLPVLHELKMCDLFHQDDTAFQQTQNLPPFPPLQKLQLLKMPNVTHEGLIAYIQRPEVAEVLTSLSLHGSGVTVPNLSAVLVGASQLKHFSIMETVTKSFPLESPPALTSRSLKTLSFEITSPDTGSHSHMSSKKMTDGYYGYLSASLHANALPCLRKLFVRESRFAEMLLAMPPVPHTRGASGPPHIGFNQELEIYAKGPEDLDWVFTPFAKDELPPPSTQRGLPARSSFSGRPISAAVATQGQSEAPQWGGGARMSVMMGNGQGGFLAVPGAVPSAGGSLDLPHRPGSSGGMPSATSSAAAGGWKKGHVPRGKNKSANDLWR
ncbi:MAG: hypothetical protein M1831_001346 [Alyxoria varia]|nr:MAG: hypothetical protein M1831_001346 [Alyxoria varia]